MCSDVQERSGTSQCCQVEQGVGGKKCGSGKQVIGACKSREERYRDHGGTRNPCHRR